MHDDGGPRGNDALVFVYNADSGLFNALTDMAHKAFSPQTYSCQLCAITHGHFGMHQEWKAFIAGLGLPCEFLHRDELLQRYGAGDARLPAIYRRRGRALTLCLDAEAIAACADMEELQRAVQAGCLDT